MFDMFLRVLHCKDAVELSCDEKSHGCGVGVRLHMLRTELLPQLVNCFLDSTRRIKRSPFQFLSKESDTLRSTFAANVSRLHLVVASQFYTEPHTLH